MRNGMRLTYLAVGDPLLGQVWHYKNLNGVEAIEQKLSDSFFYMSKISVTDVIDTLYLGIDELGNLKLPNTGINGDVWPMLRRLDCYRQQLAEYPEFKLLLEIEFPTVVTDNNWERYAELIIETVDLCPWVHRWQLMTMPEMIDSAGMLRCSSVNYIKIMRRVAMAIHANHPGIEIGGPGILQGIVDYVNSAAYDEDGQLVHQGWLAEVIGEMYSLDPQFDDTSPLGILEYIDFFAFQGRQNFQELNYNIYQQIINTMREGLVVQAQRCGMNLDIPFYSTYQGHFADKGNITDMQLQGYRDLREFANAWAVNVIPFKTQLIDEFFDEDNPDAVKNVYGLLYYYLGNDRKPAWIQYQFVLNTLQEFVKLPPNTLNIKNKRPHEDDNNIAYLMLMTFDESKLATLIFPKIERDVLSSKTEPQRVALKAGLNRIYYLPDGTTGTLTQPLDIVLRNYDFIIVIEILDDGIEITEDVRNDVTARLAFYKRYTDELLSMLPSTYPREAFDTGIYRMLRTVALELGDGAMEKEILKDNYYLATAHGDMIYNNFGVLVDLPRRAKWSDDEYRRIVSGLIESLLQGATKASVQKAISLFTDLEIHVYEMYKDYAHAGLTKEESFDAQYKFTVEIHKPIDLEVDMETVMEDAKLASDIVRPAHTLPLIMIVLTGDEDFGDWYEQSHDGKSFSEADDMLMEPLVRFHDNQYGWKANGYELTFRTDDVDKSFDKNPRLNGILPIGPRYTLSDVEYCMVLVEFSETMPKPEESMLATIYDEYSEEYDREIEEEDEISIEVLASETKFGIKTFPGTLRTNGGLPSGLDLRVNCAPTGFGYSVSDNFVVRIDSAYEEQMPKPEDELELMMPEINVDEIVPKPKEDSSYIDADMSCLEMRYGFVMDDWTLTTNKQNNMHRTAVRYRLEDVVNMRMYTVTNNGIETTIKESNEF